MHESLRADLLAWYSRGKRDFPWRGSLDPFLVWVSEVMLQQTRTETVRSRFHRFLHRFPDVYALAEASPQTVCEAWAGLGYYRRALHLHAGARAVVGRHGGKIPADPAELRRLPGVGPYTAGAIASIAFGARHPAVDVNAARVLARVFRIDDPAGHRRRLWKIAGELVDCEAPGDLNQALMDVGATVCRARQPACPVCPLRRHCRARREHVVEQIPPAKTRADKARTHVAFAWIRSPNGGLWLEQRGLDGLWAGLWEPPSARGSSPSAARAALARRLGAAMGRARIAVAHELTHRRVEARLYVPAAGIRLHAGHNRRLARDPLEQPLSTLARRIIEAGLARPLA